MKKKMTYREIEEEIDRIDSLYWWATTYCKNHQCTVNQFIKDNFTQVVNEVERSRKTKTAEG